ncbi:MAG: GNAT family N-acetyltransferase [Bacillota bacterium]|nr:GNAT family N-acetyltransferase [Bacillota bacterium]
MGSFNEAVIVPFDAAKYAPARDLWERTPGVGLSGADGEEAIGRFLEKNPGLSFAALDGERLIGTALCGSDGRRGYLYHLAVDPAFRCRGIGHRLTERCLAGLKAVGIEKCHLFVISDNESGIGFWTRAGWARRDDIIVFSRNL